MHSYFLYVHSPDNTKQQDILCPSTECLLTLLFLCQPILYFSSLFGEWNHCLGPTVAKTLWTTAFWLSSIFPRFNVYSLQLFVAVCIYLPANHCGYFIFSIFLFCFCTWKCQWKFFLIAFFQWNMHKSAARAWFIAASAYLF